MGEKYKFKIVVEIEGATTEDRMKFVVTNVFREACLKAKVLGVEEVRD